MFPVFNVSGRVVGFGGRVLEAAENTPKYINTSETPVYQKSLILFGLFQAKTGIRREGRVLIVEGYTDLMRLHQAGLDHAVASSGTALTEGQVKLLSQYTRHAVLVFDGDSAGLMAALRGIDLVLAGGLHVDVAVLPRGVDPDVLILKQGPDAMRKCLKNAVSFVDFQLAKIRSESKLASGHDRVAAAKRLLATVSRIQDPMERQVVLKEIAEKLDIEEPLLVRELRHSLPGGETPAEKPAEARATGRREKAERGLLAFLLSGGAAWADLVFQIVEPEHVLTPSSRMMYQQLRDLREAGEGADPDALFSRFRQDPDASSALSGLLADDLMRGADPAQFGLDCVLTIVDSLHQERIESIRKGLKAGSSADAEPVVQEWLKAKKTLENLKLEIVSAWKKIVEF
jgi:DNA primase